MLGRITAMAATAVIMTATAMTAPTAQAQNTQVQTGQPPASASPAAKAPDSLSVYFGSGSATVDAENQRILDQAARTYRDGKPIIMVVSGGSDSTGSAAANLRLSQMRADNVLQGLVARGIPVERFQVLAKGETEPAVPAPEGTAEARNRRVEISWR